MQDYFNQKLEYLHQNPVKAEIVNNPEDYRYSSAIDYAEGRYSYFYLQKLKARADEGITPCRILDYMNFESHTIPFSILALTLHGKK